MGGCSIERSQRSRIARTAAAHLIDPVSDDAVAVMDIAKPGGDSGAGALLRLADEALYRAKCEGRKRICTA